LSRGVGFYAAIALAVFLASMAAGIAAPSTSLVEMFGEMVAERFSEYSGVDLAFRIFLNNAVASTIIFLLSIIGVGLLMIGFNGYLAGSVVSFAYSQGAPAPVIAAAIVPHGVIEVPALALASGLGLYLLVEVLLRRRGAASIIPKGMATAYLLLLAAALVEALITPIVVSLVADIVGYEVGAG